MTTTLLILEPPCAFINANDRLHYRTKATRTKAWRTVANDTALTGDFTTACDRAHITVSYRFPNNRRREVSNLQPTSKAIVDGLVDAGLIPDDDDLHVVGPDNRREYPNGTPRVTVTITPLEEPS
jgi:Holliday junction resolvase RusA-like endonuclease